MASSLFGSNSPQNNGMMQQFQQFKQQLGNGDPKAIVEQLLRSGRMSQQQFEQYSQMAQQLSGILK